MWASTLALGAAALVAAFALWLLAADAIRAGVVCVWREAQASRRKLLEAVGDETVARLGPVFANFGVHARIVITFFQVNYDCYS